MLLLDVESKWERSKILLWQNVELFKLVIEYLSSNFFALVTSNVDNFIVSTFDIGNGEDVVEMLEQANCFEGPSGPGIALLDKKTFM
jgi:hypothetical protein